MHPSVVKTKNEQLRRLLREEPTSGRRQEVLRLARELRLGPNFMARIATWERLGPEDLS
jgi:hypothetical protein